MARALPIVELPRFEIGLRLDGQALEPVPVVLEEDAEAIVPTEPAEAESVSADAGADAYAEPARERARSSANGDTPIPSSSGRDEPRVASSPAHHCARERFPGHAVRQALAAEGFVHGKFSIFHKPGRMDARC